LVPARIDRRPAKEQTMIASPEHIQNWLVTYLSKLLQIRPEEVDVTLPFERFGLDSTTLVGMTGDLSNVIGMEIDPTLAYDFPTIEKFVQAVAERGPAPVGLPAEATT
jgi:acyl carrier protein